MGIMLLFLTKRNEINLTSTVLQSKSANLVVFKIFCYFQKSVQEGSTLSLWEDTRSTCTALLEVTCCHLIYCHIWEKLTFFKSLPFHLKQQLICISHSFQAQEALSEDF